MRSVNQVAKSLRPSIYFEATTRDDAGCVHAGNVRYVLPLELVLIDQEVQ
jgi:hypothetical protein